jgi:hypothetical protein
MIVAVATIKDTPENVARFVRRNLAGGVDHLIVFLDGEQPEVEAVLLASSFVTCVTTHHDWWHGERQVELNDRQRTHATLAVQMLSGFERVEWMFHIDGDEVIHVDRLALSRVPAEARAVRLTPLEAVAGSDGAADPTMFKPLLDDEQLGRLAARGLISRPHNKEFFRGHIRGKIGVRPAPDIRVSIHGAADADEVIMPAVADPAFQVLHYESPDVQQFARKWRALLASGDSVKQGRRRRDLAREVGAALASAGTGSDPTPELRELFARSVADDVDTLRDLGVLVELDPDSWSHVPEPIPAGEAAAWDEAIERMRGIPKSSILPPSRRDAPLAST